MLTGHDTKSISISTIKIQTYLKQVPQALQPLTDEEWPAKLPGKWSRKEQVGHLIDSALNNLKRFTDAQASESSAYIVQRYEKDHLVRVNQYQVLAVEHLLSMWINLNQQILYVVGAIPETMLAHPVVIGPAHESVYTLRWLIDDYVHHLEHHLLTLLPGGLSSDK
jgi:hypothetical protein